jgi:hypothetical protein
LSTIYFPFAASFYFPWGADFLIFSKFGLDTILILVTLSHHTSLAIFSFALSPVIQAVSRGQLWQQAKKVSSEKPCRPRGIILLGLTPRVTSLAVKFIMTGRKTHQADEGTMRHDVGIKI